MAYKAAPLSPAFSRALDRARVVHGEQPRRGVDIPYLAHLMGVAALVLNDGGSEEEAIAALLHDTVEDHADKISFETLARDFGSTVADIVEACTEPPNAKGSWRDIKRAYIDHIVQAPEAAHRVILADKLDNARSVEAALDRYGEAYWTRFDSPTKDDVRWYHRTLQKRLGPWKNSPLHHAFEKLVDELDPRLAS